MTVTVQSPQYCDIYPLLRGEGVKNNRDVLCERIRPSGLRCANGNRTPQTQRVPVEGEAVVLLIVAM